MLNYITINRHTFTKLKIFKRTLTIEPFPRRLVLPEDRIYVPTLSPSEVTALLSSNESTAEAKLYGFDAVRAFDSNQLAANDPMEDRRVVARLTESGESLFGVFDGHGGMQCAQAASERLFEYIAVSLLSKKSLSDYNKLLQTNKQSELLKWYNFRNSYTVHEMKSIYLNSLRRFVETLSNKSNYDNNSISNLLQNMQFAFISLDNDLSLEARQTSGASKEYAINTALCGSCSCIALIRDRQVIISNIGDARAVLGHIDDNKILKAKRLSTDHNVENIMEVKRVKTAHPQSEDKSVIRDGRLLGQLIPLRAFGDIQYKWNSLELNGLVLGRNDERSRRIPPSHYHSPPYLIADPEVICHTLTPNDKFLVLASDGLWETLPDDKVVQLVGEHMQGKQTHEKFQLLDSEKSLATINSELVRRKIGLSHKSVDSNVATHLIRHALGLEHRKVSELLTLPKDVVRNYRDDITIIVIYFDADYLAKPSEQYF